MRNTTKFNEKVFIGEADGLNEYLARPSWDCDWYWGFGYLQNEDIHHHVNNIDNNKNIYDALISYYGDTLNPKLTANDNKNLWVFCELMATFYTLKKTAEVLGRGGSHYTNNQIKDLIINNNEVKRINEIIMPALFDEIYKLFN